MTQWLPIDTYPYDGRWGLFRGGALELGNPEIDVQPPVVVGFGGLSERVRLEDLTIEQGGQIHSVEIASVWLKDHAGDYNDCWGVYYHNPTEWLPLERTLDDLVDDAYVNGLRIML